MMLAQQQPKPFPSSSSSIMRRTTAGSGLNNNLSSSNTNMSRTGSGTSLNNVNYTNNNIKRRNNGSRRSGANIHTVRRSQSGSRLLDYSKHRAKETASPTSSVTHPFVDRNSGNDVKKKQRNLNWDQEQQQQQQQQHPKQTLSSSKNKSWHGLSDLMATTATNTVRSTSNHDIHNPGLLAGVGRRPARRDSPRLRHIGIQKTTQAILQSPLITLEKQQETLPLPLTSRQQQQQQQQQLGSRRRNNTCKQRRQPPQQSRSLSPVPNAYFGRSGGGYSSNYSSDDDDDSSSSCSSVNSQASLSASSRRRSNRLLFPALKAASHHGYNNNQQSQQTNQRTTTTTTTSDHSPSIPKNSCSARLKLSLHKTMRNMDDSSRSSHHNSASCLENSFAMEDDSSRRYKNQLPNNNSRHTNDVGMVDNDDNKFWESFTVTDTKKEPFQPSLERAKSDTLLFSSLFGKEDADDSNNSSSNSNKLDSGSIRFCLRRSKKSLGEESSNVIISNEKDKKESSGTKTTNTSFDRRSLLQQQAITSTSADRLKQSLRNLLQDNNNDGNQGKEQEHGTVSFSLRQSKRSLSFNNSQSNHADTETTPISSSMDRRKGLISTEERLKRSLRNVLQSSNEDAPPPPPMPGFSRSRSVGAVSVFGQLRHSKRNLLQDGNTHHKDDDEGNTKNATWTSKSQRKPTRTSNLSPTRTRNLSPIRRNKSSDLSAMRIHVSQGDISGTQAAQTQMRRANRRANTRAPSTDQAESYGLRRNNSCSSISVIGKRGGLTRSNSSRNMLQHWNEMDESLRSVASARSSGERGKQDHNESLDSLLMAARNRKSNSTSNLSALGQGATRTSTEVPSRRGHRRGRKNARNANLNQGSNHSKARELSPTPLQRTTASVTRMLDASVDQLVSGALQRPSIVKRTKSTGMLDLTAKPNTTALTGDDNDPFSLDVSDSGSLLMSEKDFQAELLQMSPKLAAPVPPPSKTKCKSKLELLATLSRTDSEKSLSSQHSRASVKVAKTQSLLKPLSGDQGRASIRESLTGGSTKSMLSLDTMFLGNNGDKNNNAQVIGKSSAAPAPFRRTMTTGKLTSEVMRRPSNRQTMIPGVERIMSSVNLDTKQARENQNAAWTSERRTSSRNIAAKSIIAPGTSTGKTANPFLAIVDR